MLVSFKGRTCSMLILGHSELRSQSPFLWVLFDFRLRQPTELSAILKHKQFILMPSTDARPPACHSHSHSLSHSSTDSALPYCIEKEKGGARGSEWQREMMNCADDSFGSTLIHFSFALSLSFLCFLFSCFVYCFRQHSLALFLSLSLFVSLSGGLSVWQLARRVYWVISLINEKLLKRLKTLRTHVTHSAN